MKYKIFLGLLVLFVTTIVLNANTYAVSGSCFFASGAGGYVLTGGSNCNTGSHGPNGDYGDNDVLPRSPLTAAGLAIPDAVVTKNDFIFFINNMFNNGNTHQKIGAAFIIQSNRGFKTWPSASDVQNWIDRMNSDKVTVIPNAQVTGITTSSWYDDVKQNIFYSQYVDPLNTSQNIAVTRQTFQVYSNGVKVSQIERGCGNATVTEILPDPQWEITPLVSATVDGVDTSVARAGQVITWSHRIKNIDSAANNTNKLITYSWKNIDSSPEPGFSPPFVSGGNWTVASSPGLAPGTQTSPAQISPTYTVTAADVAAGKVFCRETVAYPSSPEDNGGVESTASCITTQPVPPPVTGCRPMQVTVGATRTDVHSGRVNIHVKAINTSTLGSTYSPSVSSDPVGYKPTYIFSSNPSTYAFSQDYQAPIAINPLPAGCNSGDVWRIEERINVPNEAPGTYTYWHYDQKYSCGTKLVPKTCTRHIDLKKTYSKDTNVGPCYNYRLKTALSLSSGYTVEADGSTSVNPLVDNVKDVAAYNLTHSKNSTWNIVRVQLPPDRSLPANIGSVAESASDPCAYIRSKDPSIQSAECLIYRSGTSIFSGNNNSPNDYSESATPSVFDSYPIPDLPPGSKVCFMFSIKGISSGISNYNSPIVGGSDNWVHSAIDTTSGGSHSCLIIVKKPKTQVWGSDLWVGAGKSVISSTSIKNIGGSHIFGSWVEYGIFAPNFISGTASGSAFAGVTGQVFNNVVCDYNKLTFTSAGALVCTQGTSKGLYMNVHAMPDIEDNFPGGATITNNVIVANDLHN